MKRKKKYQTGGAISYNPNLATKDEAFQQWYSLNTPEGKHGIPFSDKLDYDYYSAFRNNDIGQSSNAHFTDRYKRPNHPTFSDESIYSVPENQGGHWEGDKFTKQKHIPMGKSGTTIKKKAYTKVSMSNYAQAGTSLPTAYSSAPRPNYQPMQPIKPKIQPNDFNYNQAAGYDDYAGANPQAQTIQPNISGNTVPSTQAMPAAGTSGAPMAGAPSYDDTPKSRFNYGNAALTGLLAVDALIPNQKPKYPAVRPGLSYNEHPYGTDSSALMADGGWIKKAVNPAHKGWCTPLSNPHCTGHRRALAERFKHGDLHKGEAGMTISEEGYKHNSPDVAEPHLRIPSNQITMDGVKFPVYGEDEYGNGQMMYPGEQHQFQGRYVDETPIRMQAGGNVGSSEATPTYQNYDQIQHDNEFARQFVARKGAPAWLAQNTVVARNIGDPKVQFQHQGGSPQSTAKLAYTLPTGVTSDDIFQTNEGQYGYYNNDSNFTPVDAATIYSLYGHKPKPILGGTGTSTASFKEGGKTGNNPLHKLSVYETGGLLQDHYKKGSTHDLSEDEIKSLVASGYKLKFV